MERINLFSTREVFPIEKGDQTIIAQRIRVLSKKYNVRVFLIGNHDPEKQAAFGKHAGLNLEFVRVPTSPFLILWRLVTRCLFGQMPFQVAMFSSFKLKRILKILPKTEIKLVYTIRAAAEFYEPDSRSVIEAIDSMELNITQLIAIESQIWKKILLSLEAKLLKKNEKEIIARFSSSTFVADRDKDLSGNGNSFVLPNGMHQSCIPVRKFYNQKKIRYVFSGNFSYLPNIEAAKFLLNIFSNTSIDHTLTFIGVNGEWLYNHEQHNISYFGPTQNMINELSKYDVYLCPVFKSSGIQNKVLEASAAGLPVFMSTRVADAFKIPNGLIEALPENLDAWIELLYTISKSPNKLTTQGAALQGYLLDNFNWNNIYRVLEKI